LNSGHQSVEHECYFYALLIPSFLSLLVAAEKGYCQMRDFFAMYKIKRSIVPPLYLETDEVI